jgi:hypothetical protein
MIDSLLATEILMIVTRFRYQTVKNIEVLGLLGIICEILIFGMIRLTPAPEMRSAVITLPEGCTEAIVYLDPPKKEDPTCR